MITMMKNFISKISLLLALIVAVVSCEVQRWEEVPVGYRNIYCIDFGETTDGVWKYHLYYEEDPYALLTYSNSTLVSSVSEIMNFVDNSRYIVGESEIFYDFSFTQISYNEDNSLSYRYFTVQGYFNYNINTYEVAVTVDDGYETTTNYARVYEMSRPYADGFDGYTDEYVSY